MAILGATDRYMHEREHNILRREYEERLRHQMMAESQWYERDPARPTKKKKKAKESVNKKLLLL